MKITVLIFVYLVDILQGTDIEKLIKELDDSNIKVREKATSALIDLWENSDVKKRVEETLVNAKKMNQPEVVERCKLILDQIAFRWPFGKDLAKVLGSEKLNELYQADEKDVLRYFKKCMKDREQIGLKDKRL